MRGRGKLGWVLYPALVLLLIISVGGGRTTAGEVDNAGIRAPARSQEAGLLVSGYTDYTDHASWTAAAGGTPSCITFTELPVGTNVTTQYLPQGAEFRDGSDAIMASTYFVRDGVGLDGRGRIRIKFTTPQTAIGVFFPGALTIELFASEGGASLYTSQDFASSGTGHFGGVVSGTPFTYVELRDWVDDLVYVDDICYGGVGELELIEAKLDLVEAKLDDLPDPGPALATLQSMVRELLDKVVAAAQERAALETKLDAVETALTAADGERAALEIKLDVAAQERATLETKLDAVETALTAADGERAALEAKLDEMSHRTLAPGQQKDK